MDALMDAKLRLAGSVEDFLLSAAHVETVKSWSLEEKYAMMVRMMELNAKLVVKQLRWAILVQLVI